MIKVKTLTGKEIEIDIEPGDTIERIKERVEEKEGIPPVQQRWVGPPRARRTCRDPARRQPAWAACQAWQAGRGGAGPGPGPGPAAAGPRPPPGAAGRGRVGGRVAHRPPPPCTCSLIFAGKQMSDEKTARDFNIEGGSVLHLVGGCSRGDGGGGGRGQAQAAQFTHAGQGRCGPGAAMHCQPCCWKQRQQACAGRSGAWHVCVREGPGTQAGRSAALRRPRAKPLHATRSALRPLPCCRCWPCVAAATEEAGLECVGRRAVPAGSSDGAVLGGPPRGNRGSWARPASAHAGAQRSRRPPAPTCNQTMNATALHRRQPAPAKVPAASKTNKTWKTAAHTLPGPTLAPHCTPGGKRTRARFQEDDNTDTQHAAHTHMPYAPLTVCCYKKWPRQCSPPPPPPPPRAGGARCARCNGWLVAGAGAAGRPTGGTKFFPARAARSARAVCQACSSWATGCCGFMQDAMWCPCCGGRLTPGCRRPARPTPRARCGTLQPCPWCRWRRSGGTRGRRPGRTGSAGPRS